MIIDKEGNGNFKELNIICDGKRTNIIVDGEELGYKCTCVTFSHNSIKNEIKLRIEKETVLTPEIDDEILE